MAMQDVEHPSVLIVEDDPANAKLAAVLLSQEGWKVRIAASAEDALDVLHDFHPDLILLDLILPRMSGLLLATELKADPATSDIVMVALSAANGPVTEKLALAAGCAAYVHKPIDALAFPAWVRSCLEEAS